MAHFFSYELNTEITFLHDTSVPTDTANSPIPAVLLPSQEETSLKPTAAAEVILVKVLQM